MKPHLFYLISLLWGMPEPVCSQQYFYNHKYYERSWLWEAGASLGAMNCLSDLGGKKGPGKKYIKDINWKNSRLCAGIHTSLLYNYILGISLNANFGKVTSYDSILRNDFSPARTRYVRNLHFQSKIAEIAIVAELYPLAFFNHQNEKSYLFSPCVIAGIGVYHFNPIAQMNGKWIQLQPMHTEGQGFAEYPDRNNYTLTQLNFPIGIGIRWEISALFTGRLEILYRILRTDYLDDASRQYINPALFENYLTPQDAKIAIKLADRRLELNGPARTIDGEKRGNPENNDAYFSIGVKVGLILNRKKRF